MSKLAIVTGGTRGIGKATALELKDKGFTVVANFVDLDLGCPCSLLAATCILD